MRIRQIELVGFKSFREPTRLAFMPGINAIVGPNGCGKSNVADAVRWVLGEQSVKHLRARDMEDVIFCGNEKSSPLNFAEVTLTFEQVDEGGLGLDGEDEGLASQIARQAEFSVTRRIHRSGESQYLINQSPARLRDITELFLGSGVGPKAYAMIEQGRVSRIVQAKPEELRLFIEEAAGTTRFRSRKIACERKLERVQENLLRVADVMRELDRQLGALRRQARRAEEYRRLQEELQQAERSLLAHRFGTLSDELATIDHEVQQLRRILRSLQEELATHEAERDAALRTERETKQEIESGFVRVREVSSAVVRAGERQAATLEALASLEGRLSRLAEEAQVLSQREQELEAALTEAEGRRGEAAQAVGRAEMDLESSSVALRDALSGVEGCEREHVSAMDALNAARADSATAEARRTEASHRRVELAQRRERVTERVRERMEDLVAATASLESAGSRHEDARSLHDRLEGSRRLAAAELRSHEETAHRLEEEQRALREAIFHVQGRIVGLKELESSYHGYAEGIATIMQREAAPRGLVVDVLEIPADLEAAAAAALGETLRGAVVDTAVEGAGVAESLRATADGRVSMVPLDGRAAGHGVDSLPVGTRALAPLIGVRPGFEPLRDVLFGNVALASDLDAAVAAWRSHGDGLVWVTPAGDAVDCRGVVTGGQAPVETDLLERRRVLAELAERLRLDEAALAATQEKLATTREERGRCSEALERLDSEAHSATLELVAAEHARDAAQRDKAAVEARLAEAREELSTVESLVAQAEQAAEEAEALGRASARAREEGEQRVSIAAAAVDSRREELATTRLRQEAVRDAVSRAREALTEATAQHAQRQHEGQGVVARRRLVVDEMDALSQEIASSRKVLADLEQEVETTRQELAQHEERLEAARDRARRADEALQVCEEQLARARRGYDESRERCSSLENRVASLEAQRKSLAEQAQEHHGIALEEVDRPSEFDEADAAQRMSALRSRIEQLGDVNLAAIADERELEERRGFLEGQRTDLESSMEDLRQTIGELSRKTRTRFKDTFESANEKFREIFVELFHGGDARLKLTAPSNLLETGVEMEVQPPGKRVGSLEMLSGGERALTAVSLIMALFALRSTPFCVLDEVDAPLDEANVGRFNSLLVKMSSRTQFIIITHKQRTMETAAGLYGVTMAEAGVSQLVSVRLGGGTSAEGQTLAATA